MSTRTCAVCGTTEGSRTRTASRPVEVEIIDYERTDRRFVCDRHAAEYDAYRDAQPARALRNFDAFMASMRHAAEATTTDDAPQSWLPEPLTGRDAAEAVAAGDLAGQVEAAPWSDSLAEQPPWSDSWLTAEDRRAWRRDDGPEP